MKKISFVAAIGLAALATNAAPVTINHSTAGALATELQAALAEVGQTEMSYISVDAPVASKERLLPLRSVRENQNPAVMLA